MRKRLSIIVCILFAFIYAAIPNFSARAESLTVTGAPGEIKVGQTFTISITVPKNIGGSVYVEYSKDILNVKSCPGSDVGTGSTSYTAFFNSSTEQVTFEAKTTGSATIRVYMVDAEYSDKDPSEALPTVEKYSKTINVINEVVPEVQKSGDNSLASLKLSTGSLSPSFKYNVTKYTATVGYDVDKVVVSAKTSNETATIESVTDDGNVNLKVGENTIKIVVRAENGQKATYTIVVTRKAKETPVTPQPSESESESESETTPPEVNEFLQYNGEQLYVPGTIPAESIPAGFESKLLVVNGKQMQGLSFTKADLKVLYLTNTNGAGALYVYDEVKQTIYPFIQLNSGHNSVIILLPEEETAPAPEGYESCTFSIEGKGIVKAYQMKEKAEGTTTSWNPFAPEIFHAAPAKMSEIYLIYCMNNAGEKGWYLYDIVEETFMRYFTVNVSVPVGGEVSDNSDLQDKYTALEKELNATKMTQYIIIGGEAAVILILIIVIIVLVVKNRKSKEELLDEYEDNQDDYAYAKADQEVFEEKENEESDSETTDASNEEIVNDEVDEEKQEDDEDDEIEIEFYEMESEAEAEDSNVDEKNEENDDKEDDEIEIEFFNMEENIISETEATEETPVVEETPAEEDSVEEEIKIVRKPRVKDHTSKFSSKKEDDDDDLEFIDFE